jgi:rRNA-processing protein FCF1
MRRYRSRGILVDTNILLLYFVGKFNRDQVPKFKRTNQFTPEDFDLLVRLLSLFKRIATTPNVLSEVSNLSGQLDGSARTAYFREFARGIETLDERYVESAAASRMEHFPKLGLTDSAIFHCSKGQFLLLTDDSRLYELTERSGIDVINFNHLRQAAWMQPR